MKNVTRHTGTLQVIDRVASSTNGNPRYLVLLDGYTARAAGQTLRGLVAMPRSLLCPYARLALPVRLPVPCPELSIRIYCYVSYPETIRHNR